MQRYPLAPVVAACIRTLSSLTIRSRMRVADQIQLLVNTIDDECRESVQLVAATCLVRVLRVAPSAGNTALALRMLELASVASLRHNTRGACACLGVLMLLARTGVCVCVCVCCRPLSRPSRDGYYIYIYIYNNITCILHIYRRAVALRATRHRALVSAARHSAPGTHPQALCGNSGAHLLVRKCLLYLD